MKILRCLLVPLSIAVLCYPSISRAQSEVDTSLSEEQAVPQPEKAPATIDEQESKAEKTKLRDISEISLEELLSEKFTVATSKPLNLRETPAIITVFTREDLQSHGFRDLIDILRLVPGFEPGLDVWGNTGIGFRGNWAYEGKALVLLDGQSLVDRAYTNVTLGNRLSIDQIDRIEIIRGPGSAIYGREAELVVINIITRIGREFGGMTGSYNSGYFTGSGSTARQNFHLSTGRKFSDDLYLGLSIFKGFNKRTDQSYTDINGTTLNLKGFSSIDPGNILLNFRWLDLKVKFLYEDYRVYSRDGYSEIVPYPLETGFLSYNFDVSNCFKSGEKYSITPQFKFSRQKPWHNVQNYAPTDPLYYSILSDRYSADIKFTYVPIQNLHFLLGTNYEFDHAEYPTQVVNSIFQNGRKSISYHNFALYTEVTANNFLANPTAGIRFEHHNLSGNSIVPRFGLTKVFGDFHAKFIYNQAFRNPSIEQFNAASTVNFNLKPEKTQVIETEAGYNYENRMFITVGFYDIVIKNPIVYFYDSATDIESYVNYNKVGTRGLETEYRFTSKRAHAALSYSYYAKTRDDTNRFYTDPLSNKRFLAFPNHKISVHGSLHLFGNFHISPTLTFVTERSAYASLDPGTSEPVASTIGSDVLVDLYFLYKDLFTKGMDLGVGIYDIFNNKPPFIQPYNGFHSPIPGPSRMITFNLSYSWEEAKKKN